MLGQGLEHRESEFRSLGSYGQLGDIALVVRIVHEPRLADRADNKLQALRRALLGALIVVEIEDQVVRGGVADLEVEAGELLELTQEVDRLV